MSTTQERAPLHVPSAAAAALGIGLVLELLRLWFPAVAFIFGRAGSTDPLQLGGFALLPFLLAFLVAPVVRWRGSRPTLLTAAGVVVIARLVTQAADGGDLQLLATTVGTLAGLGFIAAAAGGGLSRRALAVGLPAGLAVDAALELLLSGGSIDVIGGVVGWALLLPLLALFGLALTGSEPGDLVLRTRAWPWLLVGPVLAVHLILGGLQPPLVAATTGDVVTSARLVTGVLALVLAAAYALTVRYAYETRPRRQLAWPLPLVVLVVGGASVALQGSVAVVLLSPLLVLTVGAAAAHVPTVAGSSSPARHAVSAAGGTLLLFLVAFPYYATYDLPVGISGPAFVTAAVLGLAVGLLVAATRGTTVPALVAPGPRRTLSLTLAAALALAGAVAWRAPAGGAPPGDGFPVTVALANVHMGFDTAGRYVAADQGDALASYDADVIVLNEVDRGWALDGGQDVLHDLARELDMPYVFAPAADEIWGNAILTRYPVLETGQEILPDSGGYMIRSAVWVVLDVGGGREVAVVGTHLHHRSADGDIRLPQVRRLAALATELSRGGRPVVVAGDLNALPGSPELVPLDDAFRHAANGTPPLTYPAWEPERAIDHVYVSPDLRVQTYEVSSGELSDHLWVIVRVVPRT